MVAPLHLVCLGYEGGGEGVTGPQGWGGGGLRRGDCGEAKNNGTTCCTPPPLSSQIRTSYHYYYHYYYHYQYHPLDLSVTYAVPKHTDFAALRAQLGQVVARILGYVLKDGEGGQAQGTDVDSSAWQRGDPLDLSVTYAVALDKDRYDIAFPYGFNK